MLAWGGILNIVYTAGSAGGGEGSGIPVYPKKILQNTQNSSKYTQFYTQVYFIPEIQRKWYTKYPYLSCNIPYTRFKKPLYTVYPKTLADPDKGRLRPEIQPLTLLYTIFDRIGTPLIYNLLIKINGTPFTYPVKNVVSLLTAVNTLSFKYEL